VDTLSERSALQAQRITRAFLAWLRDADLVRWSATRADAPTPMEDRDAAFAVGRRRSLTRSHAREELPRILLGCPDIDSSEAKLRASLVTNLVFWAALRPSQVAGLPVASLSKGPGGLTRVELLYMAPRFAPAHVWTTWMRYRRAREERIKCTLAPEEPALCGLQGRAHLTAWTVWAIVKSVDEDRVRTPRQLRAEYLRRITSESASSLKAERATCGLSNLQPLLAQTERIVSDAQLRAVLRRVVG
jgi:hypothetical protein